MIFSYIKKMLGLEPPAAHEDGGDSPQESRIIMEVREMIIENTIAACMIHEFEEDLVVDTIAAHTDTGRGTVYRLMRKVDSTLPHELTGQYNLKTRLINAATATAALLLDGVPEDSVADQLIEMGFFPASTPRFADSTVTRIRKLSKDELKKLAGMGRRGVDFLVREIMKAEASEISRESEDG